MMTNLLLDITSATIDWSRAQFALTAIYHWLFVPLTPGTGSNHGHRRNMLLPHQQTVPEARNPFSAKTLWRELRHGRCHRHHPGI